MSGGQNDTSDTFLVYVSYERSIAVGSGPLDGVLSSVVA